MTNEELEKIFHYAIYTYYHLFDDDYKANPEYDSYLIKIANQTNYDEWIKELEANGYQ